VVGDVQCETWETRTNLDGPGVENWTLRLFGLGGWEEKATRALLDRVKGEMRDPLLRSLAKV
jgi:hypothetical protein